MSDTVIKVEHISKGYIIRHQAEERYTALRDVLANGAKSVLSSVLGVAGSRSKLATEEFWALNDISFEVKQGERVGIIGRNGAGKSTLLKILSRITEPTKGRVHIKGRVASLLEVGTGFHPELTGRENISLNGAILGMSREEIRRKFDEIVAFAEVEKFLDTPVKRYSSGMYVRLAFAVAAHLEPEILVVDEVLAVGDAAFQKKSLEKMENVAKQGRTVLFVSHNMAAVLNLCQRAIFLRDGCISREGTARDVVNEYLQGDISLKGEAIVHINDRNSQEFYFVSARVKEPGKSYADQISLKNGVDIELEYKVLQPIRGANVVVHLWNQEGICVLTSTDVDQDFQSIMNVRHPGTYLSSCHIPNNYFRSGRYYIGISSSIPSVRTFANHSTLLSFEISDSDNIDSRIGQGRKGVISPILNWKTISVT